jgi:prepilin-type processing-associated H-X9-DG protein/prepilin-type N-terminal cleavage/methylation domain-containing protein
MICRVRTRGFTIVELLVVLLMIGLLLLLLMPAVQMGREAARRAQCSSNLMQITAGVLSYEQAHRVLPPGVVNAEGPVRSEPDGYHFSWLVQVLPFVGRESVYGAFDFRAGVYAPANTTARAAAISMFVCPSAKSPPRPGGSVPSSFAACHNDVESPIASDNHGVFFLNSSLRSDEIEDGARHTIFLGEKLFDAGDFGWASGTRATLRNMGAPVNSLVPRAGPAGGSPPEVDPLAVGSFSSRHPNGANFAFGDGSVRFVSDSADLVVLQRLANRLDGSLVGAEEY